MAPERRLYRDSRRGGTAPLNSVDPLWDYTRSVAASITGGHVCRKTPWSFLYGKYGYADYNTGRIWALVYHEGAWANRELLDTSHNITCFGLDEAGSLYLAHRGGTGGGGILYRVDEILSDNDADELPDQCELFYGLNTNDAGTASLDSDGDGSKNRDEYLAGTNPTNDTSVLKMATLQVVSESGTVVSWRSEAEKLYFLERSSNALHGFSLLATTPPLNFHTDTTATADFLLYRIGVE